MVIVTMIRIAFILRLSAPCGEFELSGAARSGLLLTRKVWGRTRSKYCRSVEAAADAGFPVVVVHPPYRWQRPFRRWLVDDLPSVEERTGVAVAVENMFPVRVAGRDLTFHSNQDLEVLEGMHHLALDTSHAQWAARSIGFAALRHRSGRSIVATREWVGPHLPPGTVCWTSTRSSRTSRARLRGRRFAEGDLRPASATTSGSQP